MDRLRHLSSLVFCGLKPPNDTDLSARAAVSNSEVMKYRCTGAQTNLEKIF